MPYKDKEYGKKQHAEYMKKYQATKRGKKLRMEAVKRYQSTEKGKAAVRRFHKNAMRRMRRKVILAGGGKCVACGWTDIRALDIHHVHRNGKEERGFKHLNMYGYFKKVIRSFESNFGEYEVLCANHHRVKTYSHLTP